MPKLLHTTVSMTTTSTFRERWQGDATSLYISCMMTIGVPRMQTALLARLINERRRRRRNMDHFIQTTNMWLHSAKVPQRSRRTVLMKSRHKVFWVVHRVVCLFLLGQLATSVSRPVRVGGGINRLGPSYLRPRIKVFTRKG